jgi:hypothetical protein
MDMDIQVVRELWSVVEQTETNLLLNLNDNDLVTQIINRLQQFKSLNPNQYRFAKSYVSARTVLIRDLAQSRFH